MRYLVPQFLETQQRIWGPFTFANFVIFVSVAGALFVFYMITNNVPLVIVMGIILMSITLGLMFYRYNGRPVTAFLTYMVRHLFGARRYLWKGIEQQETIAEFITIEGKIPEPKGEASTPSPRASMEAIEELSKMLDK